jgi:hypothetical protein
MTCPNGHDNPAGQHFCGECGAPLAANRSEAELLALAEAEAEAAEARAAAARVRAIKARNATASGSQSGQPAQKSAPSPRNKPRQTRARGMPPPAPNWSRSAAKKRKVLPWVLLAVVVLFFGACTLFALAGSTGKDIPAMYKDGIYYQIGDSAAGTYETQGSAVTRPCNWTRLGSNWDQKETIEDINAAWIDGGHVGQGETARVTVKSGEYFVSHGCLPWRYVD